MIYLATPYTSEHEGVMFQRFLKACDIAGKLMQQGEIVFSPIAHTHPIAVRCKLPRPYEYWEKFDRQFIGFCEKLVVVKMPGWQESKGVTAEIALAKELGKPVEYMEP